MSHWGVEHSQSAKWQTDSQERPAALIKKHEAEEKTRAEAERETAYHRLATCSRRSDGDLNF